MNSNSSKLKKISITLQSLEQKMDLHELKIVTINLKILQFVQNLGKAFLIKDYANHQINNVGSKNPQPP